MPGTSTSPDQHFSLIFDLVTLALLWEKMIVIKRKRPKKKAQQVREKPPKNPKKID